MSFNNRLPNNHRPPSSYWRGCLSCKAKYKMDKHYNQPDLCPDCFGKIVEKAVIYDRDRGIGQIPANLRGRL